MGDVNGLHYSRNEIGLIVTQFLHQPLHVYNIY